MWSWSHRPDWFLLKVLCDFGFLCWFWRLPDFWHQSPSEHNSGALSKSWLLEPLFSSFWPTWDGHPSLRIWTTERCPCRSVKDDPGSFCGFLCMLIKACEFHNFSIAQTPIFVEQLPVSLRHSDTGSLCWWWSPWFLYQTHICFWKHQKKTTERNHSTATSPSPPISREGHGGVRPFAGEHGTASASGDPAPHQRQGCQAGGRCRAGGGAPTTLFFCSERNNQN